MTTLYFCDELLRVYGSEDPSVAEGASFAVEHWAAAGFWKELIQGLELFRARESADLPLAFWTWHDKVEDQHAAHTDDELVEAFHTPGFDGERFLQGAAEMLDGVKVFWDGLERPTTRRRSSDDPPPRPRAHRRPAPAHRHRPPRVVGRQRPHVRRVPGLGLRLRAGRLRRSRDRSLRPGVLPAAPGVDAVHGERRAPPGLAHRRARPPHGDGIRDIAFRVDDVARLRRRPQRGGAGLRPPDDDTDAHGTIRHAAIATYGDTVHTLLDRSRYDGPFAPRFEPSDLPVPVGPGVGIVRSTMWSATSSWAPSSAGCTSTSRSSASTSSCTSTTTRSPPSTRR